MEITVQGTDAIAASLLALGREMPLAMSRAVRRTAATVQTAMIRQIMAQSGLKRARVRQSINLKLASAKVPESTIRLWPGRRPLIEFSAAQRAALMSSRAFRATMASGHVGIYERDPGARGRRIRPGVWHGLPIHEVLGPPLTEMVDAGALTSLANAKLEEYLSHEIEYLMDQRTGAA